MPSETPLVEVDVADLTRAEWAKIVWGVLVRGSRSTPSPVLVIVVTVAVFGLVVAMIAYTAGLSAETIEDYGLVFELAGDLLSIVIGVYVFARSLRSLPKLRLGPYRFALVRSDEPSSATDLPRVQCCDTGDVPD